MQRQQSEVTLNEKELTLVINALNLICNGIDVPGFSSLIGVEREEAVKLLTRLQDARNQTPKY